MGTKTQKQRKCCYHNLNAKQLRLFLTWYAKLTIKMPSKQTSIFVIFKISEAIRRTFY
jgi:hypothetical protein